MQEETVQPQETPPPPQEKPLEQQLAEAQAALAGQRETLMRALADADNARKRAQADAAASQKYALERFAEGLLPVIDSLEAAIQSKELSGVELTLRQLRNSLERQNIFEVSPAAGERFDPHRHQAMAAVEPPPGETREPNTVVAVMQKGYRLHDRVLRPALVTVAKALESAAGNPTSDTDPH